MELRELIKNPNCDLKDGYFTGNSKIEPFLNYKHDNKGYDFDAYELVVELYREAIAPYEKHFITRNPSLQKVVEPQSIDEVNQFLVKVTQMIIERLELISKYLKGKRIE